MMPIRYTTLLLLSAGALALGGCQDDEDDMLSSMRARQDAALKNPFDYNSTTPETGNGGGLLEFDNKGFSRDAERFLNP